MPFNVLISDEFPNHRKVVCLEGGVIIAAEKEGKYLLITDERTLALAGILTPEDYDLLEKLVTVREFETEAERQMYLTIRGRPKKE